MTSYFPQFWQDSLCSSWPVSPERHRSRCTWTALVCSTRLCAVVSPWPSCARTSPPCPFVSARAWEPPSAPSSSGTITSLPSEYNFDNFLVWTVLILLYMPFDPPTVFSHSTKRCCVSVKYLNQLTSGPCSPLGGQMLLNQM